MASAWRPRNLLRWPRLGHGHAALLRRSSRPRLCDPVLCRKHLGWRHLDRRRHHAECERRKVRPLRLRRWRQPHRLPRPREPEIRRADARLLPGQALARLWDPQHRRQLRRHALSIQRARHDLRPGRLFQSGGLLPRRSSNHIQRLLQDRLPLHRLRRHRRAELPAGTEHPTIPSIQPSRSLQATHRRQPAAIPA